MEQTFLCNKNRLCYLKQISKALLLRFYYQCAVMQIYLKDSFRCLLIWMRRFQFWTEKNRLGKPLCTWTNTNYFFPLELSERYSKHDQAALRALSGSVVWSYNVSRRQSGSVVASLNVRQRWPLMTITITRRAGSASVSYTHLDVYKRQVTNYLI